MTTVSPAGIDSGAGPRSFSAARERLASRQKSAKGAPAYSRYVNRPIGRVLAAAAYVVGLTPNAVTAISAAFSFAGIAVLALVPPSWWSGALITVALVLGYALDSADGQLARLRGGGSRSGEWLDHIIDATKISTLHLAVLVAAFRWFELDVRWLLVPLVFTVVNAVLFFAMTLNDQLRRNAGAATASATVGTAQEPTATTSTLRSLLVLPTDYGLLCWVFLLLGAPSAFFIAYSVFAAGSLGFAVLALPKWFRDMAALDDSAALDAPRASVPRASV